MNTKLFNLSITLLGAALFTGCTPKVTVKSLIPADVGDKDIKNVTIERFKNDNISLSDKIKTNMAMVRFGEKPYFNIVNREDTDKILEEQKLQDSGVVKNLKVDSFGISGITSIISGEVKSKSHKVSGYQELRTNYDVCIKYSAKDNKRCIEYQKYKVSCKAHTYEVESNITITRVSNSDIIFSKLYPVSTKKYKCSDERKIIPPEYSVYKELANNIAASFVYKISPRHLYLSLELIDEEDIDYTDGQEKMLENALKLIELKDIKTTNTLLESLVKSTASKSSTALYNLAVTYEYLGDYNNADRYYQKAKNITIQNDMNETILLSAKRIKQVIANKNKAMEQINN